MGSVGPGPTSLPVGSLASPLPGVLLAGSPVDVIILNSGQSDLVSLRRISINHASLIALSVVMVTYVTT